MKGFKWRFKNLLWKNVADPWKKVSIFLLSLVSDKLDEILAAAQQTISTNEAPGPRVQGIKRERGRGFYNEVRLWVRPLHFDWIAVKLWKTGTQS